MVIQLRSTMNLFKNRKILLAVIAVVLITAVITLFVFNEPTTFLGSGGEFGGAGATGSW